MARVALDHVVKTFGSVVAVNELCIDECLVLVGPSGCGKSTALRMIAGLEEVTSGNIYIGDQLMNNLSPKDRDIAKVFQPYALYPRMNVYDELRRGRAGDLRRRGRGGGSHLPVPLHRPSGHGSGAPSRPGGGAGDPVEALQLQAGGHR